jgi:ketosteroid isomerase-like protein
MPLPSDPQALLASFYEAFARRDWAHMASCYHPEAAFRDEIFNLEGKRIGAMWRMLLESGKDLRAEARAIAMEGEEGRAHWSAAYTFGATGRKVRNQAMSRFRFKDGLIFRQRDYFPFWRWAAQALGPSGLFLGWMPRLRQVVQERARANLDAFVKAHPEYGP